MKQLQSMEQHSFTALHVHQKDIAYAVDQANTMQARRQYYNNHVLKTDGIPNPPYIQKPFSTEEREQRAQAFKQRNQSLKYFIKLIQQEVVT